MTTGGVDQPTRVGRVRFSRTTGPPLWPVALAAVVLAVGIAAKTSCLGVNGLTVGETALPWCYSDVAGIFQGRGLIGDPLPYVEVMTEYPPLTGLQWWVAGRLSASVTSFYLVTAAIQAVAMLLTIRMVQHAGVPTRRVLLIVGAPALLLTATINWDPVAVALMTAGIMVARGRTRPVMAGALLGLGGLAKVFPLLAVGTVAWRWRRSLRQPGPGDPPGIAATMRLIAAAMVTVAVVQGGVALWAPQGWASWLRLNTERPVDWDTLWYGLQVLIGRPAPAWPTAAVIVIAVVVGWIVILRSRRWAADPLLAVVGWLLLVGKVYSPQFTLWLLPLLALSRVPLRLAWPFLVADAVVVLTRFPFLAGQQGLSPSVSYQVFAAALVVRGALLLAILVRGPAAPTPGATTAVNVQDRAAPRAWPR